MFSMCLLCFRINFNQSMIFILEVMLFRSVRTRYESLQNVSLTCAEDLVIFPS